MQFLQTWFSPTMNLSFVKAIYVVSEKMARNGRKTAIYQLQVLVISLRYKLSFRAFIWGVEIWHCIVNFFCYQHGLITLILKTLYFPKILLPNKWFFPRLFTVIKNIYQKNQEPSLGVFLVCWWSITWLKLQNQSFIKVNQTMPYRLYSAE